MDEQSPGKAASQQPHRREVPALPSAPTPGGAASEGLVPQTFLELAPDAMLIVDAAGRIVQVNQQSEQLFGYARAALLGQPVELLLPERFQAAHQQHRDAFAADPHQRPMGSGLALFGRRHDGSEFPAEISLSPFQQDDEVLTLSSIRDISERVRLQDAERAARAVAVRRQALLQVVLDHLPGGAYLVRGPDARLVLANRAAETVWGAPWSPGQSMAEFLQITGVRYYAENGQPLALEELVTVQLTQGNGTSPTRRMREVIRRSDGTRLPVFLTASRVEVGLLEHEEKPPGEQETGAIATGPQLGADEAARAESEPAVLVLLQDISAIQATEQLKDEFIYLAAQELRGPVAVITGFADLLHVQATKGRRAALADWQREAIAEIGSATKHLEALVSDLLDVTRLQAGRLVLYPVPLELLGVVRRCLARLQVTTSRHTFTLEDPNEPVLLAVDAMRLEQILGHLLGNAIKFSPAGGPIEVTVQVHAAADQAEVRIHDRGIGIPVDEQAQLFRRFARASNVDAHRIPGAGLGLYLCRELVERHGGQLWLASQEGHGTTIFLTLPLLSPRDAALAAGRAGSATPGAPAAGGPDEGGPDTGGGATSLAP
jgi:PAS domain S-box-containing protein